MNVFVAYYSAAEYENLLKLADDRKNLDDKWEDWLFQYLRARARLSEKFETKQINLDVKKMDQYFRAKKLKNIAKNRSKYVTEMGMKLHKQRKNN
ncbi:MAG: hypothetical protein ABIO76_02440 [Ginsengibacter sp.]